MKSNGSWFAPLAQPRLNLGYQLLRWADRQRPWGPVDHRPRKLIVTESVFSMDGDLAPLREIIDLKEKYGAWLLLDEAHATGLFGQNRRGLAEAFQVADQVEIQRRPAAHSDIPEVRGLVRFSVPPVTVYRLITDYARFPEFVPSVIESRVLERDGATSRVYQRLDLPAPVRDRHYVIEVVDEVGTEESVIDVRWQLDHPQSDALLSDGALLPDAFTGSWRLEAHAGKQSCDAVYTIHADPAGALPAWLVTRMTESYVMKVVKAVRDRLAASTQ